MKIFKLLRLTVSQWFCRWALREINPMHPDLPKLLLRQVELRDRARQLGW